MTSNAPPAGRRFLGALTLVPAALIGSTVLVAGEPPSTPPVVQTRLALDRLVTSAIAWQNQFQCSGCHKQLVTLRVSGDTVEWSPVEGAESYDLIRGSLSALTSGSGSVDLGIVDCVASAAPDESFEDPAVPPVGEGFFYLFRIRWGGNVDGYGRASDGRERLPLAGDCGP